MEAWLLSDVTTGLNSTVSVREVGGVRPTEGGAAASNQILDQFEYPLGSTLHHVVVVFFCPFPLFTQTFVLVLVVLFPPIIANVDRSDAVFSSYFGRFPH